MKTISRAAAVVLGAGLTLGAVVAPAQADTVEETQVTFKVTKPKGFYGDNLGLYMEGSVTEVSSGEGVLDGTAYLQRMEPGGTAWVTVGEDTSPSYLYFENQTYKSNAYYRVYYEGGTVGSSPSMTTYNESVSQPVAVGVGRNITVDFKAGTTQASFKASPKFGGKTFVITKKVGKQWKTIKKVKANSVGKASFRFPAYSKKTYFRINAPADKSFLKSFYTVYTIKY